MEILILLMFFLMIVILLVPEIVIITMAFVVFGVSAIRDFVTMTINQILGRDK